MMLQDEVAVVYGAGGTVRGVVNLFPTGRNLAPVEAVAKYIVSVGGSAEAAQADALDEQSVDIHLQSVIDQASRVDISFNAVGVPRTMIVGFPLVGGMPGQFNLTPLLRVLLARRGSCRDCPLGPG